MSSIEEIKARHEYDSQRNLTIFDPDWQAHQDRGDLLRMAGVLTDELETDIQHYLAPGWEDTFRPRIQKLLDRIEELEEQVIQLRIKFANTTEGLCPVCNHSLEVDSGFWICESCHWSERGDIYLLGV